MAIKASSSITLTFIVDIKSVCRYYKLQASTSSAPSKPTVNPPSGWTTTEPSYTSGSTNSLYLVDLTVFTNNTFSYSDVSKSTSYEAAKEAYNKANAAQTAINNLNTQTAIFNTLTNNGAAQGIYMNGGKVYINADYLKSGTIDGTLIKAGKIGAKNNSMVYFNLDNGEFIIDTSSSIREDGTVIGETSMGPGKFQISIGVNGLQATSTSASSALKIYNHNDSGGLLRGDDMRLEVGTTVIGENSIFCDSLSITNWGTINGNDFATSSSRRYKDNIIEMTEEYAKNILKLRPVRYDYKNHNLPYWQNCAGMIAEEVENVQSYGISYKDNQPDGLYYQWFVPQLIKMVQIQQKQLDSQQLEINSMKKDITELKQLLKQKQKVR